MFYVFAEEYFGLKMFDTFLQIYFVLCTLMAYLMIFSPFLPLYYFLKLSKAKGFL